MHSYQLFQSATPQRMDKIENCQNIFMDFYMYYWTFQSTNLTQPNLYSKIHISEDPRVSWKKRKTENAPYPTIILSSPFLNSSTYFILRNPLMGILGSPASHLANYIYIWYRARAYTTSFSKNGMKWGSLLSPYYGAAHDCQSAKEEITRGTLFFVNLRICFNDTDDFD